MKQLMKLLLFICITFFLFACDGLSSNEDVAETQIEEILDNIGEAFHNLDTEAIITNYHEDYLHDGNYIEHEIINWQDRMGMYDAMEVTVDKIEVNGPSAIATFTLKFYHGTTYELLHAPDNFGYISYFEKFNGSWFIYGNQNISVYNFGVSSNPQGALIYLDDNFVYQTTPSVLNNLTPGNHELKLILEGYNEHITNIVIPDSTSLSYNLEIPGYPQPFFNINLPLNEYHYTSDNITLHATLMNIDEINNESHFDEENYVITLNNIDSEKNIAYSGLINESIQIASGLNTLQLRATNSEGNTGWSEKITIYGDF